MAKVKDGHGSVIVEKIIPYVTEGHEYQEIRVKVQCEGYATPEEIKQISEITNRAGDEVKKIVEQW